MLVELRVRELGVIDDVSVVLGPGMTALTGETGAGKTLLVEAIELLLGGRADPLLVRPGAGEASVEGRFVVGAGAEDGADVVLGRVVPAGGRSRAYVDGHMAVTSALAEIGETLVDLHGQHAHQSLLAPATQREALDRAGDVDRAPLEAARRRLREITAALAGLGGDERARRRELDLVRFQLEELDLAGVDDPDEDDRLAVEESRLGDVTAHRAAARTAHEVLTGEDGALDQLGAAVAAVGGRPPLGGLHDRLRALAAELGDAASDARALSEGFEDDPERLAAIGDRRHVLADLRRKYGDTLAEVMAYREASRARAEELESWAARAAVLDGQRAEAEAEVAAAEVVIGAARRAAAPVLARAIETQLRRLAMPRARFEVAVGGDRAGSQVTWLLAANPGEPVLPLAKVASGGELARTMLAARLVLSTSSEDDPTVSPGDGGSVRTLVFDEVDAGIGGEAAVAVGQALAVLGRRHQVLVVTHLPQVAAAADCQLAVNKEIVGDRTLSRVRVLDHGERVVELSRMLSGQPGSDTARRHAEELLTLTQAPQPPADPEPKPPARRARRPARPRQP